MCLLVSMFTFCFTKYAYLIEVTANFQNFIKEIRFLLLTGQNASKLHYALDNNCLGQKTSQF